MFALKQGYDFGTPGSMTPLCGRWGVFGELSGERVGDNLAVVSVIMGYRGFTFSGRGISEAGEAIGMFCSNRTRSSGSRGAEKQELLVQDVELDLTGTANMSQAVPVP